MNPHSRLYIPVDTTLPLGWAYYDKDTQKPFYYEVRNLGPDRKIADKHCKRTTRPTVPSGWIQTKHEGKIKFFKVTDAASKGSGEWDIDPKYLTTDKPEWNMLLKYK